MNILALNVLQELPASLLPRLVDLFAVTTPNLLAEIQHYQTSGDLQAMGQSAHKLKGSCISLGAQAMAEICHTLQVKGEQQDSAELTELTTQLNDLYPLTLKALQDAIY